MDSLKKYAFMLFCSEFNDLPHNLGLISVLGLPSFDYFNLVSNTPQLAAISDLRLKLKIAGA